jgi:hypothetical protein
MKNVLLLLVMLLISCGGPSREAAKPGGGGPGGGDPCDTPRQLKNAVKSANRADVVSLQGVNPLNCPEVGMTEQWAGGKLIFSDSPEHPSTAGKVYEDTTLGATSGTDYNRIFVYHTNGMSGSNRMKWTVLIKNNGGSSGTLTVQRSGTAGPTTSYLYAGKKAFERWLLSSSGSEVSVAAGATVRLDTTFDSVTTAPSYLMHGIWDYSMTQAHTVTVCALGENDDPLQVCPGLSVLSRDTHQRGTCPYADKVYDFASGIDTADNIQQFPMAGDTTNDADAQCVDATDSSTQELNGNFGVLYKIHMSVSSSDGRDIAFLMNPRGGAWGGAVWTLPGLTTGGKFLIPAGTGSIGSNADGAVEGRYAPGGGGGAPWLQWMPTGGSSLPLRFVAVPY